MFRDNSKGDNHTTDLESYKFITLSEQTLNGVIFHEYNIRDNHTKDLKSYDRMTVSYTTVTLSTTILQRLNCQGV